MYLISFYEWPNNSNLYIHQYVDWKLFVKKTILKILIPKISTLKYKMTNFARGSIKVSNFIFFMV